jgi:hypothetical protein
MEDRAVEVEVAAVDDQHLPRRQDDRVVHRAVVLRRVAQEVLGERPVAAARLGGRGVEGLELPAAAAACEVGGLVGVDRQEEAGEVGCPPRISMSPLLGSKSEVP